MGFQQFPPVVSGGGGGGSTVTSIKNAANGNSAYVIPGNVPLNDANSSNTRTLSGALTANTLKTMISASAKGTLFIMGVYGVDATSRALRLKITLDGVVAYDSTSTAVARGAGTGLLGVGTIATNSTSAPTNYVMPVSVDFNTSVLIEISSSLTETDKLELVSHYVLK